MRSHQRGLVGLGDQGSGRKFDEYGRQRVCAQPDCVTVLSRYNSESECSIHLAAKPISRGRVRAPAPGSA